MTASFITKNGITTIKHEWPLPTQEAIKTFGLAAEKYFSYGFGNHGTEEEPIIFADLDNQAKLDVIDDYLKETLNNSAKQMHNEKIAQAAKEADDQVVSEF